jgi:hypothetical protein
LLKRGIGGKPARYGGKEKSIIALGHPRSHNRTLAASKLIECGRCRRLGSTLFIEGFCFARHYDLRFEYDNQNSTRQHQLISEPIKLADFRHGDGHVIGDFMPANPLIDIGIGQRQEMFEECQPRLIHAWDMFYCITAQDQIQFFRAAMNGAVDRALASDFKPVHEKSPINHTPRGVCLASFPQFLRWRNSFVTAGP